MLTKALGGMSLRTAMALAITNNDTDSIAELAPALTSDTFQKENLLDATQLVAAADKLVGDLDHRETALRGYEVATSTLREYMDGVALADRAATTWAQHVAADSDKDQRLRLSDINHYFSRNHSDFLAEKLAGAKQQPAAARQPEASPAGAAP